MKLTLCDPDVVLASEVAALLEGAGTVIGRNIEVEYVESLEEITKTDIVLADPGSVDIVTWLAGFRKLYKDTPLILTSSNPGLLKDSTNDPCFAMYKPYGPSELITALRIHIYGGWEGEESKS